MTRYPPAVICALWAGAALAQPSSSGPAASDSAISSTGFDLLDVNKDGSLSQSEAESSSTFRFSTTDRNGDGRVTRDEYTMDSTTEGGARSRSTESIGIGTDSDTGSGSRTDGETTIEER